MTRIYLIRHAEAEGNIYRIAHGQYNSALTDKGWLQVRALLTHPLGRTEPVQVELKEATPITGGLLFEMISDPLPVDPTAPRPRLGVRGRAPFTGPKRGGGAGKAPPKRGKRR